MAKLLALFVAASALLLAGCGGPEAKPTDTSAEGRDKVGEATGQKRLNEDFSVIPAPEGVKTGTPGPSGK